MTRREDGASRKDQKDIGPQPCSVRGTGSGRCEAAKGGAKQAPPGYLGGDKQAGHTKAIIYRAF